MQETHNRKLLILLLVLVMLVGGSVGGSLAWLLVETPPLENTFTSGNIGLILEEPNWKTNYTMQLEEEGQKTVEAFKCMPGDQIPKDPTVTVTADSADCYVRIFMVIWWQPVADGYYKAIDSKDWFKAYNHPEYTGWWTQNNCVSLYDETNDFVLGIVNEYRYNDKISSSAQDQKLRPLFDYIQVPEHLETEQFKSLNNFKLIVFAQAVQSTGFQNADEAFAEAGLPEVLLTDCVDSNGNPQTLEQIIYVLENQKTLYPKVPNNS